MRPHRSRGQNFLIDGNIAQKIVSAAELLSGDPVVEVGPGAGALTVKLARRNLRIVAVELDRGLALALKELLYNYQKITVVQQDVIKINWSEFHRQHFTPDDSITLISNLPYNISTPFLYGLYEQNFPFKKAILMLQKEVAMRLTAKPGNNYGALSVFSHYYTTPRILFSVSRSVFWPRPEVDSAVVAIQPRRQSLDDNVMPIFWQIVRLAFQQRRKMIANSLRRVWTGSHDELILFLRHAGINPKDRAEVLSVEQFAKIAQIVYDKNNKCN